MRKEVLGLLSVVAFLASACSAGNERGSADADAPLLTATTTTDPAMAVDPVEAQLAAVEMATPTSSNTRGEGSTPAQPPATSTSAAAPDTARTPTTVAPVAPYAELGDGVEGRSDDTERDDEPVFDAEPLRPLDLTDVVVDDAGLGSLEVGQEPGELPTGWAAFDLWLSSELLAKGNTAASVAVSIGGDVVHASAFGTRVPGTWTPTGPDDRFRVASISKTITSVTLLRLVEEGIVGLDEPVGERVAQYLGVPNPSGGSSRLTIRQLLTHTSGYGDYFTVFFRNGSTDCRHAATIGLSQGGGGGGYQYSNMNYCIAGLLIEVITGQSYETVVYEKLLTPLGLSGLRLAPTFDPGPVETQHVTTDGRNYMETLGAAGAWIASPTDLVTILNSLDRTTPGWKPLEDTTMVQMLTPVYGEFGQRGYGMGMIIYGAGRYGHTGTIENTHAMMLNRGDGVIWSLTVAGPFPSDTPNLEAIINRAFEAGGFVG